MQTGTSHFRSRFIAILIAAVVLRLICAAVLIRGRHSNDHLDFLDFGYRMLDMGPSAVYTSAGEHPVNYPPLALYILAACSWIVRSFGLEKTPWALGTWLIMCGPSILIDLVAAILIFRICRNHLSERLSLILPCVFLFHPGVIYTSSVFWQTDGWLTACILGILLALRARSWLGIGVLVGIGMMTKPQMLFVFPTLLAALLATGGARAALKATVACVLTVLIVAAPWTLTGSIAWFEACYTGNLSMYPKISSFSYNLPWLFSAIVYGDMDVSHTIVGIKIVHWWFGVWFAGQVGMFFMAFRAPSFADFHKVLALSLLLTFDLAPMMHERYMYYGLVILILSLARPGVIMPFLWLSVSHLVSVVMVCWDKGVLLETEPLFGSVKLYHVIGAGLALITQAALVALIVAHIRRPRAGTSQQGHCDGSGGLSAR